MARVKRLHRLLEDCWSLYDGLREADFIVRPSIPILYFGDSKRYFASPIRITTVGLNPSRKEFPEENWISRFPAARSSIAARTRERNYAQHADALNAYFRMQPYKAWFGSLEPILYGLNASYYEGFANTAVHTDICSPFATAPTWSKLSRSQKSVLLPDGVRVWHSLIEHLSPDIIVISIAKRYLEHIRFPATEAFSVIWTLKRHRPYQVVGKWLKIDAEKQTLLVFGQAANTPFGTVSYIAKQEMGSAIHDCYCKAI